MACPLRIEYPGTLYHFTCRGECTRDWLIATLHLRHAYTQAEIGQATGLHYSTASRIVARQIHARNKT
jgi:hypothetical protein